jgi:hypothetical protein
MQNQKLGNYRIYDKETIKICNQLGSHQMACEKDKPSSRQQWKTSETSTAKLKPK